MTQKRKTGSKVTARSPGMSFGRKKGSKVTQDSPETSLSRKRRNSGAYEPQNGVAPHIDASETPSESETTQIMRAVSHGLGVEAASAYAGLPSCIVRNWLTRGQKQELDPFDASKFADEQVKKEHLRFHEYVTMPCFHFFIEWKRTRAEFLMKCVKKVVTAKDWRAQAWLLERAEPGQFVRPALPNAVKRELGFHEKEVEATIVDGKPNGEQNDVSVEFYIPDNGRT